VIGAKNEVMNLRTRASNTFLGADGLLHTKFSTMPVNYQSGGSWKTIDDTLVAGKTTGTLTNRADDYAVTLPASSTDSVSSTKGGLTVTSQLQGVAAAQATNSGQTATYTDVFPGVDEIYTSRPDSLEQSFKLAFAAAPTSYNQTVTLSDGYALGAIASNGSIPILDPAGATAGVLPAPFLRDSSSNVDTNTSSVDTLRTLRIGADLDLDHGDQPDLAVFHRSGLSGHAGPDSHLRHQQRPGLLRRRRLTRWTAVLGQHRHRQPTGLRLHRLPAALLPALR
jgi:hypothetical protein